MTGHATRHPSARLGPARRHDLSMPAPVIVPAGAPITARPAAHRTAAAHPHLEETRCES